MQKEDPTVKKVVNAFIDLVDEKDYPSVTITEIARRAGVSRMTFYRKFSSKEEVAKTFIETCGRRIAAVIEDAGKVWHLKDYFQVLFQHISTYGKLIRELYHAGLGQQILTYIDSVLFHTLLGQKTVSFDRYGRLFYSGAFYNVVIGWVMDGMTEPVERMADKYCSLITG